MQSETPANASPSLLDVQLAFAHWRKHRSHPREATPEHLRHLAIALLSEHSAAQITSALGLGAVALKKWAAQVESSTESGALSVVPLPVPLDESPVELSAGASTHAIHLPNGVCVSLSAQLPLSQILQAASELGAAQ